MLLIILAEFVLLLCKEIIHGNWFVGWGQSTTTTSSSNCGVGDKQSEPVNPLEGMENVIAQQFAFLVFFFLLTLPPLPSTN